MPSARLIALDFSTLDCESHGSGQYKYGAALISALSEIESGDRLVVIGSRSEPVPELRRAFEVGNPRLSYVQFPHGNGPHAYWADQIRYAKFLHGKRVSIIHNLHGNALLFAPCPVIVTKHDLMVEMFQEYSKIRRSRAYRINRWAVRHRASRVVSISATTAADLRKFWGIRPERIDVVHHGDLLAEVRLAQSLAAWGAFRRYKRDEFTILSPYNLEPRKNLSALLRAVSVLRTRYPEITLTLFGRAAISDEREQEYLRLVGELGLHDSVSLTGLVKDGELVCLYHDSDIFVFPSLYEGFGLPVLEAMAAGKPVIARNASAMAEIAGEAGMLVETRNPVEIANAISALIENPPLRARLGQLAAERARKFTVKRMAELTYASYQRALAAA